MICQHCYKRIVQEDFTPRCRFNAVEIVHEIEPIKLKAIASAIKLAKGKEVVLTRVPRSYDGPHDLVDFNKWWDDMARCRPGGWHHMVIEGKTRSFGPHEPHTVAGRPIYPVYETQVGEQVLGAHEQNGWLAYKDMWPLPHKKTSGLLV